MDLKTIRSLKKHVRKHGEKKVHMSVASKELLKFGGKGCFVG